MVEHEGVHGKDKKSLRHIIEEYMLNIKNSWLRLLSEIVRKDDNKDTNILDKHYMIMNSY